MVTAAFILGLVGTISGCFSLFILSRLARGVDNTARKMGLRV